MEERVQGSRFIASIGLAQDTVQARMFVDGVRAEFPDATHQCWAFVAGPPSNTAHVGLSDASEPKGTAGRPILNTLLHSGVGDIVAVVTRYFGGVKLGKGRLGRAYARSVSRCVETVRTSERMTTVRVRVRVGLAAGGSLLRLLDKLSATEREEQYSSEIEVVARVPVQALARLEEEVSVLTSGEARVECVGEAPDRG